MKYCPDCAHPLGERLVHGRQRPACPQCGFVHYAGPKVAAGIVATGETGLVLVRRNIEPGFGRWSIPSGYVDLGETPEAAARREAHEETGLDIAIDGLVGVYTSPARPVVFIVYAGHVTGGTPALCEEVQAIGQFDPASLPPLAFDHDRQIVEDWQRWLQRGSVQSVGGRDHA